MNWPSGWVSVATSGTETSKPPTKYELATTGLSLNQVKASAGGITLSAAPRYGKYSVPTEKGGPRGFNTPDKKVELYSHSFAAHGYPALPEYEEPLISPVSRPDIAAEYPLVLTNAKFTTYIHSQLRGLSSLRKASPEPTADIHPDTAKPYGIKDKEWMIVESPRGSIRLKRASRMASHLAWCVVNTDGGRTAKILNYPATMPTARARPIQVCSSARMLAIRSAARCRTVPISAACALRFDSRPYAALYFSILWVCRVEESCLSQARTSSAFLSGGKTG